MMQPRVSDSEPWGMGDNDTVQALEGRQKSFAENDDFKAVNVNLIIAVAYSIATACCRSFS